MNPNLKSFFEWQEKHFKCMKECYNNEILRPTPLSEKEKKPERDTTISEDEIMDLKIALNSNSVEEFLRNL